MVVLTGWWYYRGRVIFRSKHVLINVYFKHIRASHRMEVPCIYKFTGQAKYAELLEKLLDFDNNLSVRKKLLERNSDLSKINRKRKIRRRKTDNRQWISGRINEVKNKEKCTSGIKKVVVGRINGVVALTGRFYKKMYGRFAVPKKSGRNNEVAVLTRWS